MTTLPEIAAAANRFPFLFEAFGQMVKIIDQGLDASDRPFVETEREVVDAARRVGASAVKELLCALVPGSELVEVEGVSYRRMSAPSRGHYTCLDGDIYVDRHLYRQVDVRNGPTIDPVALAAGIIEGMTPTATEAVGRLMQGLPSREAHEVAGSARILGLSRSSLQRKGVALGELWENNRFEGSEISIENVTLPNSTTSIGVSVDRVSVPIAEPKSRPPGRPKKGAPKRPIDVVWRMAYCGVITWYDAEGAPLGCVRYGEMPREDAGPLLEARMKDDLDLLLNRCPGLLVVTLADGAAEMQQMLDRIVSDVDVACRLIDFWHALEYLAAALKAIGEPSSTLAKWRKKLRDTKTGATAILLRLCTMKAEWEGDAPDELSDAIRYFNNHQERMKYATARQSGLPIGSGTVEATCKTLVTMRMKRPGCRWSLDGGQAILALRALATSGMWTTASDFLVAKATRDVRRKAAA